MSRRTVPSPGPTYFVGRALLRPYLWVRYRPRVSGRDAVPHSGPILFVSNHLSGLDTILIPSFAPRRVQFLAKASLFHSRLGNWFFREIGAIPVQRESSSTAQGALDIGRRVLEEGSAFAVFPEGSRSRDGKLYRGRTGAAWLAIESGATVIPVGLVGTNRRLRNPKTGRTDRVELRFGQAVELGDLLAGDKASAPIPSGKARREATERIMAAIAELSGQERVDGYIDGGRGA